MKIRITIVLLVSVLCVRCGSDSASDSASAVSEAVQIFGESGTEEGKFSAPRAVELDPEGNLYIIDMTGRVQVFNPDFRYVRSFLLPQHEEGTPTGFCITPDDRIYIADTHYSRILVFNKQGDLLHTFGQYGHEQGCMIYPTDVAVDHEGNVYVAEYGKNDRIIKFNKNHEFIEEWGGSGTREGEFQRPMALEIDAQHRLLVCDSCNHRVQIFDLDGNFIMSFGQVGKSPGNLKYPYDIACSESGTIFVCEYGNCRVQAFSEIGEPLGTMGSPGRAPGELYSPWGLAVIDPERLVVADTGNNRMIVFPVSTKPALPKKSHAGKAN